MKRRKATALTAPASLAEATAMIDSYAALSADVAAIEAERAIRRAAVDKDCDERIASRTGQMSGMFAALQAWWAVAGDEVAKGKRSAEIGAVEIGQRKAPNSLKMKGTAKANVAALLRAGLSRFLSVKYSLNKDAIKRELVLDVPTADTVDLTNAGFTVSSKDEFFIQPLAERDSGIEVSA